MCRNEDAVQDTIFNSWRFMDRFEGKQMLRKDVADVDRYQCLPKLSQNVMVSSGRYVYAGNERLLKKKGVLYEALEMLMDVALLPERYKVIILLYY